MRTVWIRQANESMAKGSRSGLLHEVRRSTAGSKIGPFATPSNQTGMTLIVVLVMLLLITLVSITSFKISTTNVQAVSNMQLHNQVLTAAQGAIESTISKPTFTTLPGVAVTSYASVNGGTTNDIQIVTTATCVEVQPIPTASLNLNNPNDVGCIIGVGQQNGVVGTNGPNSMCANSVWNIQAVATDLATNATATVNQGEAVRVPITATCP
jgi:Tfp pilus assembly protein PilX